MREEKEHEISDTARRKHDSGDEQYADHRVKENAVFSSYRNYDRFAAIDFETTGLGTDAAITEIGAVKVEFGEITERFLQLINPCVHIPESITAITGISDEMVADMPIIDEVIPQFMDFIGDVPLVAHNAGFDMRYLIRDAGRCGYQITQPVVDTLRLARKIWHRLPSYKLTFLTDYFYIAQPDAHRAWCDAEAAAKLYLMMRMTDK